METKMIWANFASSDLDRTKNFYTDLGFESNGKFDSDEFVSFYFGAHQFVINFFTKARLEQAVNGNVSVLKDENEIIFSLSADSKEAVDAWHEKAKRIGATIFAQPQAYQEGYTFGFSDPDGHKFNVLFWPGM